MWLARVGVRVGSQMRTYRVSGLNISLTRVLYSCSSRGGFVVWVGLNIFMVVTVYSPTRAVLRFDWCLFW